MTNKLQRYNAKRDFSKTAEPSGKIGKAGPRLRYVVQKHVARRLHYDFRLELNGVLKSWAVTRGPSIDPSDKRLAVEVEDHPVAYGDFEGTIPAGQYGGGTVQLWDRGYWQPSSPQSPEAALKAGELKFELEGERLSGSWVLVRMRHDRRGGNRTNWLLIKHPSTKPATTATAKKAQQKAAQAILDSDASIASGRSMAQIAAGEGGAPVPFFADRTGRAVAKTAMTKTIKSKTIKKTIKSSKIKTIPAFIEPALCKLVSQPPQGEDWLHEVKLDGYRLQLRVDRGKVTLKTRKGLDWTHKFSAIAQLAHEFPPCLIDGEMVALDAAGNPSFAALQAALAEDTTDELVFFAFDLLFLDHQDLRTTPLSERKQQLQDVLAQHGESHHLRYVNHVLGNGNAIWNSACQLHLEGVISKRSKSAYTSGRGDSWQKTKCRAGHEVVIGGITSVAGQLRSLLVGTMRDDELVYVGRVGTGFGITVSRQVMPQLKTLFTETNPFHGVTAPRKETNVQWVKPKLVAEIEFAGWTDHGMVRQAAFKGLRADKPASEVQAEKPQVAAASPDAKVRKATRSSLPASRPTRNKTSVTIHTTAGVNLSHPDKVLWPAEKSGKEFTKLDLANYYLSVGDWLLPHLRDRPCSIVRMPDGLQGEQFFQRHATLNPSPALKTIKIAGDRKPYLMIDSPEALAAVAQLAGTELHPGNCIPGAAEVPGRLVFDLDPSPEVAFKAVIAAALELRERLAQLGMTSFCKTTGGKGLHVVVPLVVTKSGAKAKSGNEADWPTAKLFAQTLCAQMAEDNPQQYLITMSKAARRGRIFLDYLRNDRLATAVCPLSPRARPGATVSMPLTWSQVRAGLNPQRFTMATALALLNKTQPWSDYHKTGSSLTAAAKLLLKNHRHVA